MCIRSEQPTNSKAFGDNYTSLDDMRNTRNIILQELFECNGFVIKLIGDNNQPAIVIFNYHERPFVISGFVKNFIFKLTTKPYNGTIVNSIRLRRDQLTGHRDMIIDHIESSESRPVYRIQCTEHSDMFFNSVKMHSGVNHIYWSTSDQRLYISRQRAESMQQYIKDYEDVSTTLNF